MRRMAGLVGLWLTLLSAGCGGKSPPVLTEAEGMVLLDDEPLPHAYVQFVPQLTGFGAEYNSTAVTDEAGKFKLVCYKTGLPGAVIGKHGVVVIDYLPPEVRGKDAASQAKFAEFIDNLKNRP